MRPMIVACLLAIACTGSAADPGSVLDDWHAAAAEADFERYFGHFADDAIFLGTDATERWTVAEFREWSAPYFDRETAWTYTASERHVATSPDGKLAWVDELLTSEKYGKLRGTAVLRRSGADWKIAHYSMTFLVPNEVAGDVVERIRAGD